jgi:hypothetical protein
VKRANQGVGSNIRLRNDCLKLAECRIPLELDLKSIECENVRDGGAGGNVDVRCTRYAGREGLPADGGAPRVQRRKADVRLDRNLIG